MPQNPFSRMSSMGGHVPYQCSPETKQNYQHQNNLGCMFCDGGLTACVVCGGFEGSLPTQCPGTHVDWFTREKVYAGVLDFINGTWTRDFHRSFTDAPTESLRGEKALELHSMNKQLDSMERAKLYRVWD